jgi:ArsR family metal-binding transcriptional regulator
MAEYRRDAGLLVDKIEIESVEPCFADEAKIRLIARAPVDLSEILPYLNAVLSNATYIEKHPALTLTKGIRLITIYSRDVTIAKADDVQDAEDTLAWLVEKINYCDEHRDEIEPVYEGKVKVKPLDIFSLLPQTNCRECGEQGCLAFSLLLLQEKHRLAECRLLYREEEYAGRRKRLEEVAAALGLE